MEPSFEIIRENKIRKEIEKYTKLMIELKNERNILLDKHCKALFENDEINAEKYLLKLSANSYLMDACKLGLKYVKHEIEGV